MQVDGLSVETLEGVGRGSEAGDSSQKVDKAMVHTGAGWKVEEPGRQQVSFPESPTDSYFGPFFWRCCLTPHILPSSAGSMWGTRAELGAVFLAPHTSGHTTLNPFHEGYC